MQILFESMTPTSNRRNTTVLTRWTGGPSIENLDLGGNNADEDAVVALLNSIADNNTASGTTINDGSNFKSTLSVLEIGGNKFGNDAMEALNRLKVVFPELDVAHDKPIQ